MDLYNSLPKVAYFSFTKNAIPLIRFRVSLSKAVTLVSTTDPI